MTDINTDTLISGRMAPTPLPSKRDKKSPTRPADWLVMVGLPALLILAWAIARTGVYTPGSDLGYLLGLTGGVMLLLLFLYPLRKHLKLLHSWGRTKYWFALHMLFGILGPVFILMHSTFHVGSLNAGVALTCMLLVAGSGVVGRFIYTRIHYGLYGERARFREVQSQLARQLEELQSVLRRVPRTDTLLKSFEDFAFRSQTGLPRRTWRFLTLGVRARWVHLRCMRELQVVYADEALRMHWARSESQRRTSGAQSLVATYLSSVQRVAQFTTWERLFSWWHVLHVPLVYMLVLSAIAHVVAVHIY